ncbi:potassium channel family protein [Romboutsia sp.]|uniref:potassium channel family protein n=1 Tax=Romboutsia sp. TaxID=1965302 RepID=UPI003F2C5A89
MKKKYITYNIIMAILSIIVAINLVVQLNKNLSYEAHKALLLIDNIIWIIFVVDYFIRLYKSKNKKKFVKKNIIDLVSIIPFNSMFTVFRALNVLKIGRIANLGEVVKILRIISVSGRLKRNFDEFIRTNNFNYTLVIVFIIILVGSVTISVVEKISIGDAVWWSIVTVTTVGYGDISPVTPMGRFVAAILMILGIGFISSLTSTLSTYFIKKEKYKEEKVKINHQFKKVYDENTTKEKSNVSLEANEYKKIIIGYSIKKLEDFDNCSKEELQSIFEKLISIK